MLDIKFIRTFPELVAENIKKRRTKNVDVNEILALDKIRLDTLKKVEDHRALRNAISEKISKAEKIEKEKLLKEALTLKEELKKFEDDLKIIEGKINEKLLFVPNMLAEDVPDGINDDGHKELYAWTPSEGYLSKEKFILMP